MRHLIVNADDFGACSGVNRGIVEAHRRGIVTSTSLMVERSSAEEAAGLAAGCPELGVGLHATLDTATDPFRCQTAIEDQIRRFEVLLGRRPTHLDIRDARNPKFLSSTRAPSCFPSSAACAVATAFRCAGTHESAGVGASTASGRVTPTRSRSAW